jgi:hypothetical protein
MEVTMMDLLREHGFRRQLQGAEKCKLQGEKRTTLNQTPLSLNNGKKPKKLKRVTTL